MSIHLTPDQEHRIQAVVDAGTYPSASAALEAAVAAVEIAAGPGSDRSHEEMEQILLVGLASSELSENAFWDSVESETNSMLAAHQLSLRA